MTRSTRSCGAGCSGPAVSYPSFNVPLRGEEAGFVGAPPSSPADGGRGRRGRACVACWRRRACWWATIPPAVPRQAATRDAPTGEGRPRGIAHTDAPAGHVTDCPCGARPMDSRFHGNHHGLARPHKIMKLGCRRPPTRAPLTTNMEARRAGRPPSQSSPADGGRGRRGRACVACWRRRACWWATIPPAVPRQAATRDRPYGGRGHEGSPLRVGGHEGSPLREGGHEGSPLREGGHEGSPLREGGHEGSPLRVGVHEGSPLRVGGHEGSPLREGVHEGSPLRGKGGHEGSPLRVGGRGCFCERAIFGGGLRNVDLGHFSK